MVDIVNIGTLVAVVAATPATVDAAGFAALPWVASVGDLVSWGKQGDTSASIDVPLLSGRMVHRNGAVDGGLIGFEYQYTLADAGQVILRAQANSQTTVSVRETHTDGRIVYYHGVVCDVQTREKTNSTTKGQTGSIRVNSAAVTV